MRPIHPVVLAAGLALAGCGGDAGPATRDAPGTTRAATSAAAPASTRTATATPTENAGRGIVLKTAGSAFGTMLFDGSGQAIYLFDREATSRPRCYEACALAWPPVLAQGSPRATGGVRSGLLGTTERTDGTTQVTYAGHPLYYYAHEGRNEVLCHNVTGFGGLWLVVTPSGDPAA